MAILTTTNQGLNFIGGTTFIQTGTTTVMSIETSGNVGIGTTSALALLSVGSGSLADTNVPVQISTSGGTSQRWFGVNKDGSYGLLMGYLNGGSIGDGGVGAYIRNITEDPLYFMVSNSDLAMTILANKNVGIGTDLPSSKLDVRGTLRIDGGGNSYIYSDASGVNFETIGARFTRFLTNGSEKMRITSAGGISFGSTGTAYGTSGQILKSNGNASPTWIDGSAIPGVPGGSGTVNTIPLWTPDGDTLGNSVITQASSAVRIGTTTYPDSEKLTVAGGIAVSSGTYNFLSLSLGTNESIVESKGTYQHLTIGTVGASADAIFKTANTEKMRIDSSGNVGIGTTSPTHLLNLSEDSTNSIQLVIDNTNTTDAGTETSEIRFRHYRSYVPGQNDAGEIIVGKEQAWDQTDHRDSYMAFGTRKGSAAVVEKMRIDSDGNVQFSGATSNTTVISMNTTDGSDTKQLSLAGGGADTDGQGARMRLFGNEHATNGGVVDLSTGNIAGSDMHLRATDLMLLYTSNSERIRINSSGNVGINTTSPNHKLDIYSNENVPLRIHRPNNSNLDSAGAFGIGFSTRGDAITSLTDTRAGIFSYYNGNLFLATNNTRIDLDPDSYARLTILNTGSIKFNAYDSTNNTGTPTYILGTDASGNVVKVLGGDIPGGGGTVTGSGTATQVAFWDGNTSLSGNNELYWDNTNGCLGINDTTPSSRLKILSENTDTSIYTVDIKHVRDDADVATHAMRLNVDLSGADNTTADRLNSGLLIDLDSSANGDASNEHRIYGVNSQVNFTGFTDLARGGHFLAESNYTGAKTSQLVGVYGNAVHDANSTDGGVSNMYGVYGISSIQDKGDVDNAFGVYGSVSIGNNRSEDVGVTKAVEGKILIDKETALNYGTMIGISSIIDNNEGSVPNFGTQYLFKGDYQGTPGGSAYGIYCEGDKHYFDGNVGIGTTSPGVKLHVNGTNASVGTIGTPKNDWYTTAYNGIQVGDGTTLWGRAGDSHFSGNYYVKNNNGAAQDTYINSLPAHDFWLDNSSGSLKYRNAVSGTAGDAITFNTRFVVLNNGYVGIGTTLPGTKLHVGTGSGATVDTGYQVVIDSAGIAGLQILSSTSHSGRIVFGDSDDNDIGMIKYDHTDNSMGFRTNGSGNERMRIDSSGNVGIGTTSPTNKIHAVAASAIADESILRLSGGANGFSGANDANVEHSIIFDACAYKGSTGVVQRDAAKIAIEKDGSWNEADSGTGTRASLVFSTNNGTIDSSDLAERMRIDSSGAVLIGGLPKIDTATKLQVGGNDSGVTSIWSNADDIVFEHNTNLGLTFATPNDAAATIAFADPESVQAGWIQYLHDVDAMRFGTNGNNERMRITSAGTLLLRSGAFPTNQDAPFLYRIGGGSLAIGSATETGSGAHIAFYTNSLERMRIAANGGVGINMTTSPSEKLEVNGNVKVQGDIIVNSDIELGPSSRIQLDDTPTASTASGSGTIVNWSVSESTTAGNLYAVKTNGGWTAADADAEVKSTYMLAIALSSNANLGMLLQGFFYKASHGFTIGAPLYVSNTLGAFSNSRPTGSGDYVRIIGYATSTNYIYFDPDKTWVKIA